MFIKKLHVKHVLFVSEDKQKSYGSGGKTNTLLSHFKANT